MPKPTRQLAGQHGQTDVSQHNVSHQEGRESGRGRAVRVSVHVTQAETLQSHSYRSMLAASPIWLRKGLCKCMAALH